MTAAGPDVSPPAGPPLLLRRMRWWDVAAVLPLDRDLFAEEAWTAEAFWGELAGAPRLRHYLVAEDGDGTLLGYAGAGFAGSEAEVHTLAVRRQAHGRGVGAALLGALLAEATTRGVAAVLLEVRADNGAACRLYSRFGFERVGRRRGYYDQGRVDALVLRRLLGVPAPAQPPLP